MAIKSLLAWIRKRWPYVAGAVVLFVLFLILLVPRIASLGPAKSIVLSRINANLRGKLQIKSWSLGWTSGFHASDISLSDKTGEIVTIKRLSTGLTLRHIIGGDYTLGNVTVDGLHFDVQIDSDGNTNLQEAFQSAAAQANPNASANSPLPNVSGNITLTHITGTVTRAGSLPVAVSLHGNLKIPNINQPIENDLSATLQSGSAAPGQIAIKGHIAAIQNNQVVDVAKMDISENLSLKDIDLSSLSPLLPMEEIDSLNGQAQGNINIAKLPSRGIVADGEIRAENMKVRGPALRGDTYSTNSLVIKIPEVAISPDGMVTSPDSIQAQFDQGHFALTAQAQLASLENLLRNHAPGANGFVSADFQVDCAALSRELPHTLDLQSGLLLQSAQMAFSAKITLAADHAAIKQHLELSHISGTDADQPIAFSPITLDSASTILPSTTPLPQMRDISIKLRSDFAKADFHGPSLADFGGSASADLAIAQRQLAQLFDFHGWQFQGTINATLSSHGDLGQQSAPLEIASRIEAENLHIIGGVQRIQEQSVIVDFSGKILRDASESITGIDDLKLALQTNEAGQNITALSAAGLLRLNPGRSGWHAIHALHLDVDLPDLPRTASLVEAVQSQGVRWTGGKASAAIDLSESDGGLGGSVQLSANDFAFARGQNTYHFDPIHFATTGKLSEEEIDITKLDGSLGPLAELELIQPIILKTSPTASAQGKIQLHADLARVSALANAWNDAPSPQTLSGALAMDQAFSTDGSRIATHGGGTITDLDVSTGQQVQFQEKSVKIVNDLTFDSPAQSLEFNSCSIAMQSSHALDATLTGAIRHLSTSRDFDNVRVEMAYDLAAVLAIAKPLLPADDQQMLGQYAIKGVQKHTIAITGSFPVGHSLEKSLRKIRVTGSIGLDRLEGNGITITNLSPEFTLRDGIVNITGNGATAAQLNGGTLNLTGISYDLADPAQRISVPANLHLVQGTQLNAVMMGKFGSTLSPVLSNPTHAAGVLDVSVTQCTNLSLAQFSHPPAPGTSTGNIKINLSVANVQIANNMAALIGAFSPTAVFNHQLIGNINNAEVSINNGLIWSDMKLRIGQNLTLGFHGNIDMQTQQLKNFILDFPTPLVGDIAGLVHLNNMPTDVPIPITGTTSHYSLDLSGVNHLVDVAKNAIGKGANSVGKAVGGSVNHVSKFFNGVFHHDDNNQQ